LAAPSTRLLFIMGSSSCIIGRPSLIRVCWVSFGRGCWVGISMIASGLLNSCHCCALRLEGNIQVEIIPICVSSEGRIRMPCCTIFSRLPELPDQFFGILCSTLWTDGLKPFLI